ncbi:hypothetical protein Q6375_05740 [Clostridium septicum]|uniref:hypothetical protein n=1 Tax=Clostridium septicum TaxID=1504 RepID=UPI00272E7DEA|nr:hypothetical protein [Clostridium septicum]WLF70490.1 hypothetical protein Q6375_05740 [Clostridium septicum]
MEDYKLVAAKVLTTSEQTLYSSSLGAIVKTILLYNSKEEESKATLTFDSVAFKFKIAAGESKILNSPILTKNIKASGEGINIHITGLEIGGA